MIPSLFTSMRLTLVSLLVTSASFCQTAPDARGKADCEETASRLTSLMSILARESPKGRASAALRDEAANQLRLSIAVEKASCEGSSAHGLTAAQKAQIDRRTYAADRLLDMMRESDEVLKAAESAQSKAPEPKKPQEITSCVIYKQSWDDRQIDKRFAAIRKADPEAAHCKFELPKAYAAHCGAQKAAWPQDEFNSDLAALIKLSLDMSRCEAELKNNK